MDILETVFIYILRNFYIDLIFITIIVYPINFYIYYRRLILDNTFVLTLRNSDTISKIDIIYENK